MVCPKCKSQNVTVQSVTDVKSKTAHHSVIWWLCIGWWWEMFLWLFLTFPKLLATIFIPKKQKVVSKTKTICVCQNCGKTWKA